MSDAKASTAEPTTIFGWLDQAISLGFGLHVMKANVKDGTCTRAQFLQYLRRVFSKINRSKSDLLATHANLRSTPQQSVIFSALAGLIREIDRTLLAYDNDVLADLLQF